jgi:hypothetical protein
LTIYSRVQRLHFSVYFNKMDLHVPIYLDPYQPSCCKLAANEASLLWNTHIYKFYCWLRIGFIVCPFYIYSFCLPRCYLHPFVLLNWRYKSFLCWWQVHLLQYARVGFSTLYKCLTLKHPIQCVDVIKSRSPWLSSHQHRFIKM